MIIKPEELKIVYEKEDDGRIRPVYFIDAEPVRHERWIYICNSSINGLKICECTGCHRRTYGSLDFCGNCGAKMEGGR